MVSSNFLAERSSERRSVSLWTSMFHLPSRLHRCFTDASSRRSKRVSSLRKVAYSVRGGLPACLQSLSCSAGVCFRRSRLAPGSVQVAPFSVGLGDIFCEPLSCGAPGPSTLAPRGCMSDTSGTHTAHFPMRLLGIRGREACPRPTMGEGWSRPVGRLTL